MNAAGVGWILTLKDNQPGLYAAADAHSWHDEPVLHATAETGHGRHEVRTIRVTSQVPTAIGPAPRHRPAHAHRTLPAPRPRHAPPPHACRAASDLRRPRPLRLRRGPRRESLLRDRPGRHRADPRPGQPRVPARPQPRPLGHRKRPAPPPRHHPRRRRLPAAGRADPGGCSPPSPTSPSACSTAPATPTTPPPAATSPGTAPDCQALGPPRPVTTPETRPNRYTVRKPWTPTLTPPLPDGTSPMRTSAPCLSAFSPKVRW